MLVEPAVEGDFARVYRARPCGCPSDRPAAYAVKVLRPPWQDDPRAIGMLAREALVGQSVSHPHLVSVLEACVSRPPRLVVMPWLEGLTLRQQMTGGARLDLPLALWIARQVAEALQAMHAAGWIHGDVKPSNILVSPGGHVTLLDLSFARRSDETGSVVDRCPPGDCLTGHYVTGHCLMGTGNYLAPEQITSSYGADIRSDLYSLGVVLFELFSGRLPFRGDDLAELAVQHRQATPPDLRVLAPHLPVELVRLVRQMLAKHPLRRPQTPGELIDRLLQLEIATFSERA